MQRQYLDLRKARPNFTKSCSVLGEFVRHSPESRQTPMAEPQGRRTCLEAKSFSNLHHSSNFEIAARPILPAPLERKLETPGPTGPISTFLSWANCNSTTWLSLFPQLLHLPVMNIAPWGVMLKKQNEHTLPVESFSKVPVSQSFQELWFQTTPWRGCGFNS